MKRIPLFYRILLIVIGVLTIAICISLIYLWSWLKGYQQGLPVNAMDEIIKEVSLGDFKDFVSRYDFYITDFEDDEAVISYLENGFKDVDKITYKKVYSRFGEQYAVCADDEPVFTVNLRKGKKGYSVAYALLNTEIGIDIKIPKGFTLYLNDIEVTDKWVSEEVTEEDAGFELLFCMVDKEKVVEHYNVIGLLRESHVRVTDYNGEEVPLVLGDKLNVSYQVAKFLVPEKHTVYINGNKVGEEFITDTVESDIEGIVLKEYTVNGIVDDIDYCIKDDNGREMLVEDEDGTICLKEILYTIDAPNGYDVFVNGEKLDKKYIKETGVAIKDLSLIPDKYASKPTYDRYEVHVLGRVPDVEVKNKDGYVVKIIQENKKAIAGFQVPEDVAKEYYPLVEERAYMHSKYVTNDLSMYRFSMVLKEDTEVYQIYRELQPYFYTDHIGFEFKDVEIGNLQMYSDNIISCDISYDHIIYKTEKEVFTFPSSFTFYLVEYEGEWYIMDFVINSSEDA